ncbi:F0F1 ATP synthase subunit epsilon [uncultured Rothia sp.]|uniref:F0F1 ATP synthase subunit epsilon n=1 Tax=uncultured Rothia sp. TaxID=316088 RepID=UPI0032166A7D
MALNVEVVSREKVVWVGEAKYLRARTLDGDIGVMPGHIPTMALLAEDGEMVIEPVSGEKIVTRLQEGFLTVSNDKVIIAAKHAHI